MLKTLILQKAAVREFMLEFHLCQCTAHCDCTIQKPSFCDAVRLRVRSTARTVDINCVYWAGVEVQGGLQRQTSRLTRLQQEQSSDNCSRNTVLHQTSTEVNMNCTSSCVFPASFPQKLKLQHISGEVSHTSHSVLFSSFS